MTQSSQGRQCKQCNLNVSEVTHSLIVIHKDDRTGSDAYEQRFTLTLRNWHRHLHTKNLNSLPLLTIHREEWLPIQSKGAFPNFHNTWTSHLSAAETRWNCLKSMCFTKHLCLQECIYIIDVFFFFAFMSHNVKLHKHHICYGANPYIYIYRHMNSMYIIYIYCTLVQHMIHVYHLISLVSIPYKSTHQRLHHDKLAKSPEG